MTRTVVYAIGGNALSSPTGGGHEESALVLAKVMSDVIAVSYTHLTLPTKRIV